MLHNLSKIQQTDNKDIWKYNWGADFSSSQAYKTLIGHSQIHDVYQWLWKCLCQPKHKVFFWLLIKDKLSTRNILRRKNMYLDSYSCVLCLQKTVPTLVPSVPICKAVLEINTHWHSTEWRFPWGDWISKEQNTVAVFSVSSYTHLLDKLDSKKRLDLQRNLAECSQC